MSAARGTGPRFALGDERWLALISLLGVTAVFGWTFVVVKRVIAEYPVLPYLGLRFGVAVLAVVLVLRRRPSPLAWRVGLPVGAVLAAGYLAQTEGMLTVSPGIAGLVTGLFVVFTPLLDWAVFRVPLRRRTLASVGGALLGVALLTQAGAGLSIGDLLVGLGAVAFAAQIVLLSHSRGSAAEVGLVQMLVCAGVFLLLGAGRGLPYPPISGPVAVALLITGVLASGVAVLVQTWAQRRMSASSAGLVLAAEPGFALLFAVLLAGERLDPLQGVGALVLLLAIVSHELPWSGRAV